MSLFKLCLVFFYIGLFTIGGGQVAITLMQQELMDKGLITPEKFFNMVAISESTPGPIGINMATYIGCEMYGVVGGILATLSTVLPAIIIILVIAKYFKKVHDKPFVKAAFSTVKPVVTGLIAVACWNVIKIALIHPEALDFSKNMKSWNWAAFCDLPSFVFFVFGCVVLFSKKMNPIVLILLGAFFGVVCL